MFVSQSNCALDSLVLIGRYGRASNDDKLNAMD